MGSVADAEIDAGADAGGSRIDANQPLICPDLMTGDAGDAGASWPPSSLARSGLYCDIARGIIAPGLEQFRPRFQLWSDGAVKTRWIYLPPGARIDTTDPDHWLVPEGTKVWKQFEFDGKRIETRLIEKFGPGISDFRFIAFQWNDAGSDALPVPDGAANAHPLTDEVSGPSHDIPAVADCMNCHGKLTERLLGFSAIQLSHDLGGLNLADLVATDRLTSDPANATGYSVPGTAADQAALGYFHANCGNCHNDTGIAKVKMRLLVAHTSLESTDLYTTTVGVAHTWADAPAGITMRIAPGDAAGSEVIYRLSGRGVPRQMPPIGTQLVDDASAAMLTTWVNGLP